MCFIHRWIVVSVTTFVMVAGCSRESGPKRYGISGTVKVAGVPVKEGTVTIVPKKGIKGPGAGAQIVDGLFRIPPGKGPIAGEYIFQFGGPNNVRTGQFLDLEGQRIEIMRSVFPVKYGPTSTETREIGPDSTTFDFEL